MRILKFFKNKSVSKNDASITEMPTNEIADKDKESIKRPTFTPEKINSLLPDEIFVFGSNLAGHHGGGAARIALNNFGAIYGQGVGLQGQSYAIPTMQGGVETITPYVDEFIHFAREHSHIFFYVTRIGCGIAGFRDEQVAPLFIKALNLSNICLPESFVRILSNSQIKESYKLSEYGQVRTLADIAKALNEEKLYTSLDSLLKDFHHVLEKYKLRGTITVETFQIIHSILHENSNLIFHDGKFDSIRFEEILSKKDYVYDKMENIFQKRSNAKILRIIQYFNEKEQYTSPNQIISDLNRLHSDDLNDSFHYPLFFFERGLSNLWEKITINGKLDNALLESIMFEQHKEKVKNLGINTVIEMDYEDDGPCHPEVYFPREVGIGPVYVKQGIRKFIKSCGEGKGPNRIPNFYEEHLRRRIHGC